MFRFIYVIFINLFRIPYMMSKMRWYADHPEKYTEEKRYALARHVADIIKFTGAIRTVGSGQENLPHDGGYILYPNHQGKYDVLGIMHTHDKPVSFIIDDSASHGPLISEFTDLVQAGRIKLADLRQTMQLFRERAGIVAAGQRLIIFPEGVYYKGKQNELAEFKPGSFKLAKMAKVPIVPVAIYDSYKPFNSMVFGPVITYVNYLQPIPYEEYADKRTNEIAEMVHERVNAALNRFRECVG
ncbi:MAG: 1-acyl-sn-glycerol-3-phosphate acyltransferase [Lachnospiraceae bacterium]|nr:1-acyl-sn-glycerol-3-phosphate acyltransferase [Lachnospiraceae bacterium]